jgi:hypothetical protein
LFKITICDLERRGVRELITDCDEFVEGICGITICDTMRAGFGAGAWFLQQVVPEILGQTSRLFDAAMIVKFTER